MNSAAKIKKKSTKAKESVRRPGALKDQTAGKWLEKLIAVQARLRASDGCPWDREQNHRSLRTYLIEEAYEVLEALDSGDDAKFADEMGDLLLQIVFHSQIAREQKRFHLSDVIRSVHDKMIRRHPHVFGDTQAADSGEVLRNWEEIKAQERHKSRKDRKSLDREAEAEPPSILDGLSRGLPSTLAAFQLTRRAARIGFDWDSLQGVFEKVAEEASEILQATNEQDQEKIEEEVGDLLFAAVNVARFLHVDPEISLRRSNAKFSKRFREMERIARESGREFREVPRKEKEALWNAAKHSSVEKTPASRKKALVAR